MTKQPPSEPIFVDAPHPASLDDEQILKECQLGRGRSSGPGGQHRNRVQTLVVLTHTPTGMQAHAGERRSPQDNKRVALRRLRIQLAIKVRASVPIGEIGSKVWQGRVKEGKIACNAEHHDYPTMLAEAFDVIFDASLDMKHAATRLECSQSQLIKLIAKDPGALAALNATRIAKGKSTLRG